MIRLPHPIARRRLLLCGVATLAVVLAAPALAQATYPDRPITLVVGFPPGGSLDTIARALADELGKTLNQKVIVDNKPGAGGNIAVSSVLAAAPDGYSLLLAAINLATAPALGSVRYDPKVDLTMVSQVTSVPVLMLASGKGTLKSPAEAIALSKRTDGGMKVGTGGIGTSGHLAAELLARSQTMPYLHVPYRGGALANTALIAGEIDVLFDLGSATLKGFIDAGNIRPLAVMQETRVSALPDVRSAKELGLPASTTIRSWQGIAVRTGTPRSVVDRLHKAVQVAVDTPAFRARAWQLGSEIVTSKTPEAFQQYYLNELDRWTGVIKAAGIKP